VPSYLHNTSRITRPVGSLFSARSPIRYRSTPEAAAKATVRPSGDQVADVTPYLISQSLRGSPPPSGSTQACDFFAPSRSETISTDEPSGEMRGAPSTTFAEVSRSGRPPDVGTLHRWATYLPSWTSRRANTIVSPSGDTSKPVRACCFDTMSGPIRGVGTIA